MPYDLNWYIDDQVLFVRYYDKVTVDELRSSLVESHRLMEESTRQLIHVITDVGDVTDSLPPKDSLEVVREVGTSEKSGWNLILREKSILVKLSVAFGTSVFKTRTRTFSSFKEGQEFLAEMDATIDWEQADNSVISYII